MSKIGLQRVTHLEAETFLLSQEGSNKPVNVGKLLLELQNRVSLLESYVQIPAEKLSELSLEEKDKKVENTEAIIIESKKSKNKKN